MVKSVDNASPSLIVQFVLTHWLLNLFLFEYLYIVQTYYFLLFILSRVIPDPVYHTGNSLKTLLGLCELRHCGHNTQKIISPADQNFPVLTANDKITWWLCPQTPNKKSRLDFLRNDIRITRMIWKS